MKKKTEQKSFPKKDSGFMPHHHEKHHRNKISNWHPLPQPNPEKEIKEAPKKINKLPSPRNTK